MATVEKLSFVDLICAVCGVNSSKSRLVDLGRWMKKRGIEIRAALATPTRTEIL